MFGYPFSSPQAYGGALYQALLMGHPQAHRGFAALEERQRTGKLRPWDVATIAVLNDAHARYASLRYSGPGAPSWGGYGFPTVHAAGISVPGPRTLDPPTTNRLLAAVRRCWRSTATAGYAYQTPRKDPRMFPYVQEELPPSISGWPGMRPMVGGVPMNPGMFYQPQGMNALMALQAAGAYLRQQHEMLPPSIQGAYAGALRGGAARPAGGAVAAFPHLAASVAQSHPFSRPMALPRPAAVHPAFRRGWPGYGYGWPGYAYPVAYNPYDPAVYCPANGYYRPGV